MEKAKWKGVLKTAKLYAMYFFLWFGGSTLMDYLFFEEVINNEVIASNLWTSPFMALLFMIMNGVDHEDETKSTSSQLSSAKE